MKCLRGGAENSHAALHAGTAQQADILCKQVSPHRPAAFSAPRQNGSRPRERRMQTPSCTLFLHVRGGERQSSD